MRFEKTSVIAVPIDRLWDFIIDAKAVSACLPGLDEFRENGPDSYEGRVRLSIGPISLRLQGGIVVIERDRANWTARMRADAKDARVPGNVKAEFTTRLAPVQGGTSLDIVTESKILGKLGEFGQPIMKKTADKYLTQFVDNISRALSGAALPT